MYRSFSKQRRHDASIIFHAFNDMPKWEKDAQGQSEDGAGETVKIFYRVMNFITGIVWTGTITTRFSACMVTLDQQI